MVFNFTTKKKKNSKIPKLASKGNTIPSNCHRNISLSSTERDSSQRSENYPDQSVYEKISSTRAIFESHKLESACSFLKSLKEKLEKDITDEPKKIVLSQNNSTSETITDVLDTLINVSDNITPIIGEVTNESTKSLYTASGLSTLSEQYFNKTMIATSKLLELRNNSSLPTNISDSAYYFAHKIIANNVEELTIFKNSIKSVGDKIYVDNNLLQQLIELHNLLKDTIEKLRQQEAIYTDAMGLKSGTNPEGMTETFYSTSPADDSKEPIPPMTDTPTDEFMSALQNTNYVDSIGNVDNQDVLYDMSSVRVNKKFSQSSKTPARPLNYTPITTDEFSKKPNDYAYTPNETSEQSTDPYNTAVDGKFVSSQNSSLLRASKMSKKEKKASKISTLKATLLDVKPAENSDMPDGTSKKDNEEIDRDETSLHVVEPTEESNYVSLAIPKSKEKIDCSTATSGRLLLDAFTSTKSEEQKFKLASSGFIPSLKREISHIKDAVACSELPCCMKFAQTQTLPKSFYASPRPKSGTEKLICKECPPKRKITIPETAKPMQISEDPKPGQTVSDIPKGSNVNFEEMEYTFPKESTPKSKSFTEREESTPTSDFFPMRNESAQIPEYSTITTGSTLKPEDSSLRNESTTKSELVTVTSQSTPKKYFNMNDESTLQIRKGYSFKEESRVSVQRQVFDKSSPGYFAGLVKCIAELECMRTCLQKAVKRQEPVHECLNIYLDDEYFKSVYPHFHTVIDGVPIVIEITKNFIAMDNPNHIRCCQKECAKTPAQEKSTCCQKGVSTDSKLPLPCRVWETISKTAHEKCSRHWVSSILRKPAVSSNAAHPEGHLTLKDAFCTKLWKPRSTASMPYVADKTSLPKIDNPTKICSSLDFDVTTVPVTFDEKTGLHHPDGNVNNLLKNVTVEQLLDSFRPAKCCRKTVLNEKPRGAVPYAASLKSLPLLQEDLNIIKHIMIQSKIPTLINTYTLFEQYINFQKDITGSTKYETLLTESRGQPVFQVYIFELFKDSSDDKTKNKSSSSSISNNALPDLKILDFIRKIYNSEPIAERVSKKCSNGDGDKITKNKKNNVHEKRKKSHSEKKFTGHSNTKYKSTESKTYYKTVKSYSTSKSNYFLNASTSRLSTKKNHNSNKVYSFLLIPDSELEECTSTNDLSTSYAPSVNSLPFDNTLETASIASEQNQNKPNVSLHSEECDDWALSPSNYAKTLKDIYELDQNGNMRTKGNLTIKEKADTILNWTNNLPLLESPPFPNDPENQRYLSTIYEADEKTAKESDQHIDNKPLTETCSISTNRSISQKSCITSDSISSKRSRIPVSITSYTNYSLHRDNSLLLHKSSIRNIKSSLSTRKSDDVKSPRTSKINIRRSVSPIQEYEKNRKQYVESATSTKSICTNLVAKVHPKIIGRSSNFKSSSAISKETLKLQRVLGGTNDFEIPITFEIVQPSRNPIRNMKMEPNVLSYAIESDDLSRQTVFRNGVTSCYRSANICVWPQLQKKSLSNESNRAFYVSVHTSHHNLADTSTNTLADPLIQAKVLQKYPETTNNPRMNFISEKIRRLSPDSFPIGFIGGILKKPAEFDKTYKCTKQRRKVTHAIPEVIDIKMSKDMKSTKLKHKFFKEGTTPGYVTVLSTPCQCPDITIFLPCCCGHNSDYLSNSGCSVSRHTFVREAQEYAMIPISEKDKIRRESSFH